MHDSLIEQLMDPQADIEAIARTCIQSEPVSAGSVRALDLKIMQFLQTGTFFGFGSAVMLSDQKLRRHLAEKLARYNHLLALFALEEQEIVGQTAFTLLQLVKRGPEATHERVVLLQRAYPSVSRRDLPPHTMFRVHYVAAEAYWEYARSDRDAFQGVIEAAVPALRLSEHASAQEATRLHFWLGVALNEMRASSAIELEESVNHLWAALSSHEGEDRFRGSILNSLGYSLYLLGRLKDDASLVRQAVSAWDDAEPYRKPERERGLTAANRSLALAWLAGDRSESSEAGEDPRLATAERRIRSAEYTAATVGSPEMSPQERQQRVGASIEELMIASDIVAELEDDYLRARVELALGIALTFAESAGETLAAVCFLRASARKWTAWDNETRRAAAAYNLGIAYSFLEGRDSPTAYCDVAIASFEEARAICAEIGLTERVAECDAFIDQCKQSQGVGRSPWNR